MLNKIKIRNRAIVIRSFCADCAGSPLDVTLCKIFHCDLWPWRIGDLRSKSYEKRLGGAFEGKSMALKETLALGLTLEDFLHPSEAAISKTRPLGQEDSGEDEGKEVESENQKTLKAQGDALGAGTSSPLAQEIKEERKSA